MWSCAVRAWALPYRSYMLTLPSLAVPLLVRWSKRHAWSRCLAISLAPLKHRQVTLSGAVYRRVKQYSGPHRLPMRVESLEKVSTDGLSQTRIENDKKIPATVLVLHLLYSTNYEALLTAAWAFQERLAIGNFCLNCVPSTLICSNGFLSHASLLRCFSLLLFFSSRFPLVPPFLQLDALGPHAERGCF